MEVVVCVPLVDVAVDVVDGVVMGVVLGTVIGTVMTVVIGTVITVVIGTVIIVVIGALEECDAVVVGFDVLGVFVVVFAVVSFVLSEQAAKSVIAIISVSITARILFILYYPF